MSDFERDVKIGQLRVKIGAPPESKASVECGRMALDVGYAAGYRFASELTKIREALTAAHAVLTTRTGDERTSAAEVHLARLLVELEISS